MLSLAGYAVPIYLFHQLTLVVVQKLIIRFLPSSHFSQTVVYFGGAVVVICFSMTIAWLPRRWTPRLYAVLTGGRTI